MRFEMCLFCLRDDEIGLGRFFRFSQPRATPNATVGKGELASQILAFHASDAFVFVSRGDFDAKSASCVPSSRIGLFVVLFQSVLNALFSLGWRTTQKQKQQKQQKQQQTKREEKNISRVNRQHLLRSIIQLTIHSLLLFRSKKAKSCRR